MDAKYLEEIKKDANRLVKLADNPYCQGPVSLLDGVKRVVPALLAEVKRLQKSNEIYSEENHGLYQQISTLKKALELACKRNAEYAFCGGTDAMKVKHAEKNFQHFIQQALEQEGKK